MTPLVAFAFGILTACLCMLFGAGIIVWIYEAAGILPKDDVPPLPSLDDLNRYLSDPDVARSVMSDQRRRRFEH